MGREKKQNKVRKEQKRDMRRQSGMMRDRRWKNETFLLAMISEFSFG